MALYKAALKGGATRVEAINAVVDWLLAATLDADDRPDEHFDHVHARRRALQEDSAQSPAP